MIVGRNASPSQPLRSSAEMLYQCLLQYGDADSLMAQPPSRLDNGVDLLLKGFGLG